MSNNHRPRAVVFAYHNVGVRCLKVLLASTIDIPLVITHEDNPSEKIWFESVATLCKEHGIQCITPSDPKSPELLEHIKNIQPDFIFSFYYRALLPESLLKLAKKGAYNMHGSLLPKYRGRAPINWAVLHGESETGVTLHLMTPQPDAGAIAIQTRVPILPNDTAHEVFNKVTVAAEQALGEILPDLISGTVHYLPNDLNQGHYYGRRTFEDGKIDWNQPAQVIYNLYRAVAPPYYPGAWTYLKHTTVIIAWARLIPERRFTMLPLGLNFVTYQGASELIGVAGDHAALKIYSVIIDNMEYSGLEMQQQLISLRD